MPCSPRHLRPNHELLSELKTSPKVKNGYGRNQGTKMAADASHETKAQKWLRKHHGATFTQTPKWLYRLRTLLDYTTPIHEKKTEILQGSLIAALAPCKIALARHSLYLAVAAKSTSEIEACSLHLQNPKRS